MKQAKGSFCGSFPQPTEPFQASPFYGKYSRSGQFDKQNQDSTGATPTPTPDSTKTPEPNAGTQGATGGAGFDPGAYESPPQPSPSGGGTTP
jgi:penicillin-binding protein 1A